MPDHNPTDWARYSTHLRAPITDLVVVHSEADSELCVLYNGHGRRIGALHLMPGEAEQVAAALGLTRAHETADVLEQALLDTSPLIDGGDDNCLACALTAGGVCSVHADAANR